MPNPTDFQSSALATLRIEQQAIDVLATQIDDRFNRACEILLQCKGRVVITGMVNLGILAENGSDICFDRHAVFLYASW